MLRTALIALTVALVGCHDVVNAAAYTPSSGGGFYLRNVNAPGGVYNPNTATFYLKNANSSGAMGSLGAAQVEPVDSMPATVTTQPQTPKAHTVTHWRISCSGGECRWIKVKTTHAGGVD